MPMNELELFLSLWDREAAQTEKLLAALPEGQYDFRPYPGARSMGELAWHLAEIDGYVGNEIPEGAVRFAKQVPGLEPPREVKALAPGYRRVRDEARKALAAMDPAMLDRQAPFMGGRTFRLGDLMWGVLLHHHIHHRGQLQLVARLAGGTPTGLYGPTLEEGRTSRPAMEGQSSRG